MTHLQINGARLFVQDSGGTSAPILFIHGLMLTSPSWQAQVARFRQTHRVITYDLRGQGRSEMTPQGLDLDTLAEDAAALIDQLRPGRVHVVAFSMGSFIAMRLAARRPDLVRSLTLIGPSADAEEKAKLPRYRLLIALVRLFGPRPFSGALMKILFGRSFLADPAAQGLRDRWRGVLDGLPRSLSRAAAASADRKAIRELLPAITAPTLILSGTEDRPVSPEQAARVHHGIAGSRFVAVPETGHAVMIERPEVFNNHLADFLKDVECPAAPPEPDLPVTHSAPRPGASKDPSCFA